MIVCVVCVCVCACVRVCVCAYVRLRVCQCLRSRVLACVSWGAAVDAKQKGVKLAAHYGKFVDLMAEFSRTYPRLAQLGGAGGSASLHKMADQLDVTLDSDAKAGLHFCKAVALVCTRMIEDMASFSAAITVQDDYDPLHDAALLENGVPREDDAEADSRGRNRQDSPEGEDEGGRGRRRNDSKGGGRGQTARGRGVLGAETAWTGSRGPRRAAAQRVRATPR